MGTGRQGGAVTATMGGTRALLAILIVATCARGATSSAPSGAVIGSASGSAHGDAWGPSAARWLQLIQQYARSAVDQQQGNGVPRPFTVQLPLGGASDALSTLPLLVLPVPVPNTAGCSAAAPDESKYHSDQFRPDPPYMPHHEPQYLLPTPQPERPIPAQPHHTPEYQPHHAPESRPHFAPEHQPPFAPEHQPPFAPEHQPHYVPEPQLAPKQPEPERVVLRGDDKCGGGYSGKGPVPTPRLIQLFKEQTAADPHLPPALLGPPPPPLPESHAAPLPPSPEYLPPPPLLWDTGMFLRARLTVPRAGYTEPYTVWWDAASGASRVDLHHGNTTCLRQPASAGPARLLERRIDRTNEPILRVCGLAKAASSPARAPPGLPDPELFSFAGHVVHEGVSAERWAHTVSPAAGEGGAAPGESLVFRHELLVRRGEHEAALPVRYTVDVDSSVLGPRTSGYVHHYDEAKAIQPEPALFAANPNTDCDSTDRLDATDAEHMARLAPLHEYTLPTRDARHNAAFCRFKAEYRRVYADDHEDAMRKNLFVHCRRFVGSANREGATFEAEVNFLGDRLDEELEVLHGVRFDAAADQRGESFPHGETEANNLPDTFDWRELGGVTPVLYQGSCSSCWAFAVAGSVEGGLFIATRRLVPLAEQKLVDCGHEHGAHGCNGTWPVHAYNHVKSRGLPARAEYPAYAERVMTCRSPPVDVVTRISHHVDTPPRSVRALKLAVRRHAPNVVVIDSRPRSYLFYKRGVLRDERCLKGPKRKLNHAILAVGWGLQRGETYFIMKNTYSARWGDGGYISMHAPTNTCGHQTVPSYAVVRRRDVVRPLGDQPPVQGTNNEQ